MNKNPSCCLFLILALLPGYNLNAAADLSAWNRCADITLGVNYFGGGLTNFPVLIKLNGTSPPGFSFADCLAGGGDLRFLDAATNELYYQIDVWNTSGTSCVWVRVPAFRHNAAIRMFWKNPAASAPTAAWQKNTWDGTHKGVWHLNEAASSNATDSTTNNRTGTITGQPDSQAGMIGNSRRITGTLKMMTMPNNLGLTGTTMTVMWWGYDIKTNYPAWDSRILGWGNSPRVDMVPSYPGAYRVEWSSGNQVLFDENATAAWRMFAVTAGSSNMCRQYVDSTMRQESWRDDVNMNSTFSLGGNVTNGWDGYLDEVRVMDSGVSGDYITASYLTIREHAGFTTYGGTTPVGAPGIGNNWATGVTENAACLNGTLGATGVAATAVWVYWGAADGGTNKAGWTTNVSLGYRPAGSLSHRLTNLPASTLYYYRYYASNAIAGVWASPAFRFKTEAWSYYELETSNNTLNLTQFPDEQLPPHHLSVLGYGFPNFSNEPRDPLLKVLTIGHTHIGNASAFRDENVTSNCIYHFENLTALVSIAADQIIAAGQYLPEYGSFSGITGSGKNFTGVTESGARALGRHIFHQRDLAWSPDTQSWSRPTDNGSWIMMDEEEYVWLHPGYDQFCGWLMEGHVMEGPNRKIGFYGHPVTWQFVGTYTNMTDADVEDFLKNDTTYAFDMDSWRTAAPYIDLSPGYFKIPYLETNSLYMKNTNGTYMTNSSGRRIWRTNNFVEVMFGHTNHIWGEPEPDLRNFQKNDSGGSLINPVLQPGYQWASWCGHDPNPSWQPETKMMVDGVYKYADYILASKVLLNKADFGDMDIGYWRDARLKAYVERRPRTEPWTDGGNTRWIREVGATALKYNVMFAYLSGVQAVSTWDNGGFVSEESIKPYGENVFGQEEFLEGIDGVPGPHPDNYSRYVVWSAAVNTFARLMKDVPVDETLRYIRFYYPIVGARNKEVISAGIYSGRRLIVMFNYPMLDPQETLALKITAGTVEHNAVLKGREVLLLELQVPPGLDPKYFGLDYVTIEGRPIHVNGAMTETVAEHYVTNIPPTDTSSVWTAYNDLAWEPGQTNYRMTRYSFVTNDLYHTNDGPFIRHASGQTGTVSVTLAGGLGAEFSSTPVPPPAVGSPADLLFSGKVDMRRTMSLAPDATGMVTISHLDPTRLYRLVWFGNRSEATYTNRKTTLTLLGADSFVNASSPGSIVSGSSNETTTLTTGTNTGGLVFIYTDIAPGSDEQIQLRVTGPPGQKSYLNAMLLELLIADTDFDGMDDMWEQSNFDGLGQTGSGDADNDGFSNYGEYRAGTDPTSAGSNLIVTDVSLTNASTGLVLRWASVSGKSYTIQKGSNLTGSLTALMTNIPATAPLNVYTAPMSSVRGYLRVKVE